MSKRRTLTPALWPAAGLLGVVIPLSLIERLQSYLHYLAPAELWPVFGTAVLLHLPFALALALMALALQWGLLARLPLRWQARLGGRHAAGAMLLGAVLVFGLQYGLGNWLALLDGGSAWATWLPQLRWWLAAGVLLVGLVPPARRAVYAFVAPATAITALGLLAAATLPWLGWNMPEAHRAAAAPGRPHLLLVTFDALAASHLSIYGHSRPTTPELDALARRGVVFDRFYANSNFTTPSVNSILTGALPAQHRATQLPSWPRAEYRANSLPAVLQGAGYRCLAVSTNPLAGPYKNGYGAYFDEVAADRIYTYFNGRDGPSRWLKYLGPVLDNPFINTLWRPIALARWAWTPEQQANRHYEPDAVFDAARAMIDRQPDGPLFIWLHLLPPHSPYAAPAPFLGSFDAAPELRGIGDTTPPFMFEWAGVAPRLRGLYEARYDESVRYLDARAGRFLAWAQQRLGANTVVLVSADHGESFDHGYGGHAGPLLTEPLVHVPLIAFGPGLPAGTRVSEVASQIDLAPTLAALAGAAAPAVWQGRSLLPAAQGVARAAPPPAWTMNLEQNPRSAPLQQGSIALIEGRWKRVHYLGRPRYPQAPALVDQLFDLANDPGETRNLIAEQAAQSARLGAEIDRYVAASAASAP